MLLIRSITVRSYNFILLSALIQIFIFPTGGPAPFWRCAMAWFALVPFLLALMLPLRNGTLLRPAQAALLGYACGALWYLGNCSWIYQTMYLYGGLPRPVAFSILVLFSLYLGLYHAVFAVAFTLVRQLPFGAVGSLLIAPFLWSALELARGAITGFPWDLLGYSQVDNLLLTRLAPFAGVISVSFVIAAINSALVFYFCLHGKQRILVPFGAAILALTLQLGMPFRRHPVFHMTNQSAILMQENLAVGAEAKNVAPIAPDQEIQVFSHMSLNPQVEGVPHHPASPNVVVWPEAPSHLLAYDPAFRQGLAALTRRASAPAIIGSLGVDFSSSSPKGYLLYDSASLFNSAGAYSGRYDKVHLVPWGEYVPYQKIFGFAQKLTEGTGDMEPGKQRRVFALDGHAYGIFVCYESIFGDEVRQFAKNGAEVLVNISDDGWYGDSGAPWQHLNMTRMRAIENNRWLLLDTNTGITTSIDPKGREVAEAPRHVREAFLFPFNFISGNTTFYTRHGDWFAWLCAIASSIAVALSLSRRAPA